MPVTFVPEPENDKDQRATPMEVEGKRIGYIKRAQYDAVRSGLANYDVHAHLERFNGTTAWPVVYVFCRFLERRPRLST